MNSGITLSRSGPGYGAGALVARLVIDRPQERNRLGLAQIEALASILGEMTRDPPAVLVLSGAGGRFPPGLDPAEAYDAMRGGQMARWAARMADGLGAVLLGLLGLPCPVIAQVEGRCDGGVLGLILGADLVAFSGGASLSPVEPGLGPVPCGWSTLLAERIGAARAAGWLARAAALSGHEALGWGLADAVADTQHAPAALAEAWADAIMARDASGIGAMRTMLRGAVARERVAAGLAAERQVLLDQLARPEAEALLEAACARLSS
ncbi:MAG: enoyl-CoA hydratase/isomerase family protein [Rhodobacteraceae bacterium]|nr:enoyl-CoA hydratase/isomerase family protein [Paracoccaceae bacterium]